LSTQGCRDEAQCFVEVPLGRQPVAHVRLDQAQLPGSAWGLFEIIGALEKRQGCLIAILLPKLHALSDEVLDLYRFGGQRRTCDP
jgi:hypothetical protein